VKASEKRAGRKIGRIGHTRKTLQHGPERFSDPPFGSRVGMLEVRDHGRITPVMFGHHGPIDIPVGEAGTGAGAPDLERRLRELLAFISDAEKKRFGM
jgi:hypothetical protein